MNVLWVVVDNFKENVKNEISIFIKEIFLKLLNSNNSSHPHREMSLKFLKKILQSKNNLLEFYINFDCSPDHQPLIESILDTLSNQNFIFFKFKYIFKYFKYFTYFY